MLWLPVTLLTALSSATGDTLLKARFAHLTPGGMAVVRSVAPLPFLCPVLLYIDWPRLDPVFYQTLACLVPLEITALLLYMKAIKTSPLSLTIPFLAFTPVFIILTGWIVLGEEVSARGVAGILLTVCGSYVLHLNLGREKGLLAPFKAILQERGSALMLIVAVIYSLTSVLGKKAVLHSGPVFFAAFYFVLLALVVPAFVLPFDAKSRGRGKELARPTAAWLAVGLAQGVMVITHMCAINMVTAAYMIAVKRTSLVFSVIFGRLFFAEEHPAQRLAGASLMLVGVAIIATAKGQ